ncbi:hypothetical protein ACJVC5_03665 [Peredibacter sp. HCB2-198]|uniref:hypothetical protein n=1 Tax=Peredibacter sp. HCB2-198 TaxID=3383025 RepID=UPI0038B5679D
MIKTAQKLIKSADRFLETNGSKNFHLKAAELLETARLDKEYDFEQLVQESFKKSFRHEQNFAHFEFSDLPVTLARGKHSFIDIYFWRRRPTVIHNHHFTGAFQCLEGKNLDLEFEFKEKEKIGKYHAMGEVRIVRSHMIMPGHIQPIAPLNKFIHQNHHHSDLTVNLCFRTIDVQKQHLSNYLFSGLRFEKNPELLSRVERLFRFTNLGDFNPQRLELNLDDAMSFLLHTEGSTSQNKNFLKLKNLLEKRVKKETGLNITKLYDLHEAQLDKIQDEYE